MRTTTDTHTGKPFRWNTVCIHASPDGTRTNVPERQTSRTATYLHPSRVPPTLLAELNPPAKEG